jgi:integrase
VLRARSPLRSFHLVSLPLGSPTPSFVKSTVSRSAHTRVGEALSARLRDLHLDDRTLYLPDTKTGTHRPVYLPPVLVEALVAQGARPARPKAVHGRRLKNGVAGRSQTDAGKPFLERGPDAKLFRFHASGRVRGMLTRALKQAGLSFPRRQGGFHLFCHTYGTMDAPTTARYLRPRPDQPLETPGLGDRYRHTKVSEEARRAAGAEIKVKANDAYHPEVCFSPESRHGCAPSIASSISMG